jgi:hypothetical protein
METCEERQGGEIMSIDTPPITPQQYEVLHGGGAEAAEIAKQHRSLLAVFGLATTASMAGTLDMLYPNLAGQFGASLNVGKKSAFPAATPLDARVNQAGVFYRQQAKTYIVHFPKDTHFLLQGTDLSDQFDSETILKDADGSYWIAVYQRCVHLGAPCRTAMIASASNAPATGHTTTPTASTWTALLPGAWTASLSTSLEEMSSLTRAP